MQSPEAVSVSSSVQSPLQKNINEGLKKTKCVTDLKSFGVRFSQVAQSDYIYIYTDTNMSTAKSFSCNKDSDARDKNDALSTRILFSFKS